MKRILNFTIVLFFLCVLLSLGNLAYAQGGGGEDGETPDPDAAIPIDGGVSILAAAGVAYGAKKIYSQKRKN